MPIERAFARRRGRAFAQYEASELTPPIRLRPGWRLGLLAALGAPALLGAAALALLRGDPVEITAAAIGLGLFGFPFALIAQALWLGRARGLVALGEDGLYLAHLGITLPWSALAPAWPAGHGATSAVEFGLRDAAAHFARARGVGWIAGRLALLLPRQGAPTSWALMALGALGAVDRVEDGAAALARAYAAAAADPSFRVAHLPSLFLGGASPDEIAAILNAEALRRAA